MTATACGTADRVPPAAARPEAAGWARRLTGYCLRYRADLAWAYGAALVAAIATALLPLVLRHIVDGVNAPAVHLPRWVLLLGIGAVRFAAGFLRRYCSGRVSLGVQYDLRNDAFAALLRLGGTEQDDLHTGQPRKGTVAKPGSGRSVVGSVNGSGGEPAGLLRHTGRGHRPSRAEPGGESTCARCQPTGAGRVGESAVEYPSLGVRPRKLGRDRATMQV